MIVNYDKSDGWSTVLDKFKTEAPVVSEEAKKIINDIQQSLNDGFELDFSTGFIGEMEVADESLLAFLKTTEASKISLENYQSYLQSATQSATLFAKGLTTLKTIGGTLLSTFANMAIMWAATAVIQSVITVIDDAIHRSEKLIEKGEEAKQAISEIGDSYNENKTLYELYYN